MYNLIYFSDPRNFNLTLGFADVYILLLIQSLYVYYVFHLLMFCYMLLHIVIHCEIDRFVVMDRLEILTVESCEKINCACGQNSLARCAMASN